MSALQVNQTADLAVIHGGVGTVMVAALAGKPVIGIAMQMEQVANLCLSDLKKPRETSRFVLRIGSSS